MTPKAQIAKLKEDLFMARAGKAKLIEALEKETNLRVEYQHKATNLALCVGSYFGEDLGEENEHNDPIKNAHELLNEF